MIKKFPIVRITCLANDKPEKKQHTTSQEEVVVENRHSGLLEKTIGSYGVLGRALVNIAKSCSPTTDKNENICVGILEESLPRELKNRLLVDSKIKAYMQYCAINAKTPDPQKVLSLLQEIKGVKVSEDEFLTSPKSRIQHGRKFNVVVNKNLKMIFEVHDYKESDIKTNWIMRLYDDDKKKTSRSYLTPAGSFNRNVYGKDFTHIPCGENGRKFVLGY